MTRHFFLLALLLAATTTAEAQLRLGGKTINARKVVQAAGDAAKAATLSDADIVAMSREAVAWMDEHNPVDTAEYGKRLERLTENIRVEGLELNFKVYRVTDINAFACGDGSIRVFSSLMDRMTDEELIAIIGHEIGHVVHHDTRDAMKNAYLSSALRHATRAVEGSTLARLSDSELGALTEAFTGARFSRKQEYAADAYAFDFCLEYGVSPYAMSNALNRLVELSDGADSSLVQRMFSSHPDSRKRAERMKELADEYTSGR